MQTDVTIPLDELTAIAPIDGRYASKTAALREIFSEYGLVHRRVRVEIAWFLALAAEKEFVFLKNPPAKTRQAIQAIADNFGLDDARRVKEIESVTRHDVKAVEYFIREKFEAMGLVKEGEFIHFACTSEDINNMAHALMLRDGLAILRKAQNQVADELEQLAKTAAKMPMLARTHGQPASPTTLGKEIAVHVLRLRRQGKALDAVPFLAKMSGAVGNYNAHAVACPKVDWKKFAAKVIASFGMTQNPLTTQIENHDGMAELFDAFQRWNTVLIDLDRDIWSYISMRYIKQRVVKGEVGSSTMPHKVNPIDFENSEGNLGVANALFAHLARKLPISRLQRDLTDSTVIRNVGSAFAYSLIACASTLRGLSRIEPSPEVMLEDLDGAWEVLAEPIQTVMRLYGIPEPYEKLKAFTRGQRMTKEAMRGFIESLDIPQPDKNRLLKLTPASYIGIAPALVRCCR